MIETAHQSREPFFIYIAPFHPRHYTARGGTAQAGIFTFARRSDPGIGEYLN
jgi:hypothetical protein